MASESYWVNVKLTKYSQCSKGLWLIIIILSKTFLNYFSSFLWFTFFGFMNKCVCTYVKVLPLWDFFNIKKFDKNLMYLNYVLSYLIQQQVLPSFYRIYNNKFHRTMESHNQQPLQKQVSGMQLYNFQWCLLNIQ